MASILEIDTSLEFFFNVFGPAPPDAYDKVYIHFVLYMKVFLMYVHTLFFL
jgi:hypothetical protein